MANILSYNDYYLEQMSFIDRYIRSALLPGDQRRLQRLEEKQSQQVIYFLDDFLDIEEGKELDTTRIGYPPLKNVAYTSEQLILAPLGEDIRPGNRRLSRYRLVYGPVDFYLGSQLEDPTEIPVITACAPNLMGSSASDLEEFSTPNGRKRALKVKEYDEECKKLADFIVDTVKQQGKSRLVMPAFGVGVYIRQLDRASKQIAKEKMYKAFAEAALKHQIQVDWVVWAQDSAAQEDATLLASYSPDNQYMKPVIHADMMLYAQALAEEQENLVLLNPGSDRTIGGAYTHKNPTTLEEQIAQQSDLVLLHSQLNGDMVARFNTQFKQQKDMRQQSNSTQFTYMPHVDSSLKIVADHIKQTLNLRERPWVFRADENYRISFKRKNNALAFIELLHTHGVNGRRGKKKAQFEDGYYVVYLTSAQYRTLTEQILVAQATPNVSASPSSWSFFRPPSATSCLSNQQLREIQGLINRLERERGCFWSFNLDRKKTKIDALTMLANQSFHYSDVQQLVTDVLNRYPDANKGIFSNRTGEFLTALRDNAGDNQRGCCF
ncbi:hypothetical protein [Legionella maioricensis]|uniref:Uncharacterized protein n=1 Tax=Legionella maioricensis TaxID=2896528 RepID=A0A9X2D168_9GAMM|nr:hypothetical protein [Legionella maioricensis]MCL9684496.1 hypothetical protein [Legionella maioricensis]MCL9687910.1 hypothetical protein [Legionella maioricensis]